MVSLKKIVGNAVINENGVCQYRKILVKKYKIPFFAAVLTILILMVSSFVLAEQNSSLNELRMYCAFPGEKTKINLGDGPKLTFSSDSDIAKIEDNKLITKNIGKAKIDVYRMSGVKKHLEFCVRVANRQILTSEKESYHVKSDEKDFKLKVKSNCEIRKIRFVSDNPTAVRVNARGMVHIVNPGTANIKVISSATNTHYQADITIPVYVEKEDPEMTISPGEIQIPTTNLGEKLSVTSKSESNITYTSENEDIVKVGKKGKITPIAVGETKIKIKQEESEAYSASIAEIPVKITKPNASDYAMAAVEWARQIGADDSFAYGTGRRAHRKGCYFCNTNVKHKGKGYEKTYCCNTFCFSAYAHGAQIPSMLSSCKKGHNAAWGTEWCKFGFENIGKPKFEDLLPGDVITQSGHMWMISNPEKDLCVESTGGTWKASSISEHSGAKNKYKKAKFVLRLKNEL